MAQTTGHRSHRASRSEITDDATRSCKTEHPPATSGSANRPVVRSKAYVGWSKEPTFCCEFGCVGSRIEDDRKLVANEPDAPQSP